MQQEPTRNHHDHSPPAIMTTSGNVCSNFKPKNSACFQLDHFPLVTCVPALYRLKPGTPPHSPPFRAKEGQFSTPMEDVYTLPSRWPMEHWVQPLGHSKRARFAMAGRSGVHGEHGWESGMSGNRGSVQHGRNYNK